jgi:ribosomal protein S1
VPKDVHNLILAKALKKSKNYFKIKIMELIKEIFEQNQNLKPLKVGDIVEGKVVAKKAFAIYLDLGIFGTGIIYGKEFKQAKNELKKIKIGEKILAKIVDLENEEGYVELSVAGASKEIALAVLRKKKETGEKIKVKILGANKGGLLTKISGASAFLPVSQLALENYPQVENGDSQKILDHLRNFVGKEMEVKILGILEGDGQVILSEKLAKIESFKEEVKNYKVGDIVEGEITAILDFGVFLKFGKNLEGLIPTSEINSGNSSIKIGDKIKAKITSISEEEKKIYLSFQK